jgi:hypothetical protein
LAAVPNDANKLNASVLQDGPLHNLTIIVNSRASSCSGLPDGTDEAEKRGVPALSKQPPSAQTSTPPDIASN